MALGEIYIKLVVSFPRDAKVRALARYGADAGLARDLYVQMCLYCKDMLSDGLVPFEEVGLLVYPLDAEHGNQLAKQLASVGLTKEEANAWRVLAFTRRNGTREDVERLSQVRAEAGRTGGRKSRKRPAQKASQANRKQVGYQDALQTGSNAVSVSVPTKNVGTETGDIQTPTASAANGLTFTQRAKPITDAYYEVQPMCKWTAVNGIVVHAIKTGKYADEEICSALLRMAESRQGVTIESLRVEIEGLAPRVDRRQAATDQKFDRAMARARARDAEESQR
jgi:hypothetical protein